MYEVNRGKYKRGKFALFNERIDAVVDGNAKAVPDVEPRENRAMDSVHRRPRTVGRDSPQQEMVVYSSSWNGSFGQINFAIGGSTLTERRRNLCIKRNRISILTVRPRHGLRAEPPSRRIYEQSVKNINRFAVMESPVNGSGFFLRVMGRGDKRQRTFITVQPWCWTVGAIENKTIRVTIKLSKNENYR